MEINEKERGYVVEVDQTDPDLKRTATSGWAIWQFDFSKKE